MNSAVEILRLDDVKKHFLVGNSALLVGKAALRAVDGVSFQIQKGETFALVGESGCGKTTIGRMIVGLTDMTAGSMQFQGQDLRLLVRRRPRTQREKIQIIFQDPYSSLNPRRPIGKILEDPLAVRKEGRNLRQSLVKDMVDAVGLSTRDLNRFPHEFSGGQRQRVAIARALISSPELVICDEPVSALDVSIRSQILNLLKQLQQDFHVTYLFISHDLSVVRFLSDRIAVMYLGKLCEVADTRSFFKKPMHPYSQALLSVIPVPDPDFVKKRKPIILQGEIPSAVHPPSGCRFRTRCLHAREICTNEEPGLTQHPRPSGHDTYCACHFAGEFA
jgi:oligopeptide transport system ATP-binding protein